MMFNLLTIVFIVLKLVGVISWSWWVVLSPTLGLVLFVLVLVILAAIKIVQRKPDYTPRCGFHREW